MTHSMWLTTVLTTEKRCWSVCISTFPATSQQVEQHIPRHVTAGRTAHRSHREMQPSVLTLLVGRHEGHLTCKEIWVFVVCWWWHFDSSFARLIAPVVTTPSITISSDKTQNGDILVPANPGPPGKWPLKWRDRESESKLSSSCRMKLSSRQTSWCSTPS